MSKKSELFEIIKSKDNKIILSAIKTLREEGTQKDILIIIDLLHNTKSDEIKEAIKNFLNDLKDKDCIPAVISALKDIKYKSEYGIIAESCWQSGLEYDEYLSVFVELVINENYSVAFEAFTVIENMTLCFSKEEIEIYISKINDANHQSNDKGLLYTELINVLKSFITI